MIKKYIIFSLMTAFSLQAQVVYRSPEPVAPEVCVGDICAITEPDEPALPIDLDAEEVEVLEPIVTTEVIKPIVTKKIVHTSVPQVITPEPKKITTFEGKIAQPNDKNKVIEPTEKSQEVNEPLAQPEVEITQVPAETIIATPQAIEKIDITSSQDNLEDTVKIPDDEDIQVL